MTTGSATHQHINSNEMKSNIKEKYPHLFNGLGQMKNQQYDIKVKDDATPFAITVPRQVLKPLQRNRKGIKENGMQWSNIVSWWTNWMVHPNGGNAKKHQQSKNMCGTHKTEPIRSVQKTIYFQLRQH